MQFRTPLRTFEATAILLDADGHVCLVDEDGAYPPPTQRLDDYTPNALKDMRVGSPVEAIAVRSVIEGRLVGELTTDADLRDLHFGVRGRELQLVGDAIVATLPHERDGWRSQGANVGGLMIAPAWLLDHIGGSLLEAPLTPALLGPRSRLSPLAERLCSV
jgi:hypothetical protein